MPLLGFSVFLCSPCLSLILSFMEVGVILPLSHDCRRSAAKVTCLPIQTVAPDWIGVFNRGNYHSLGWLLEQSSNSQQPGCKTGARRVLFSQLQLYYLSYKWQVQEMTNADGDKLICWIGLDQDGEIIILAFASCWKLCVDGLWWQMVLALAHGRHVTCNACCGAINTHWTMRWAVCRTGDQPMWP